MITIWCLGGLGNQMFQYAFYRALQLKGCDVCLDISEFKDYALHNGYELERIFNLKPNYIARKVVKIRIFRRIMRLLQRRFGLRLFNYNFIVEDNYLPSLITPNKNFYLYGYWQNEKYFIHHREAILRDFTFPEATDENLLQMINKVNELNSVSLHVRRGDYINHSELGGICDLEYYQKAIASIEQKVANPHFFVFSNDLDWCKGNLPLNSNVTYIDFNTGKNSFRDMQLMSLCKHNIIANSSFSWWGAWLNVNPEKIVITPSKWFNNAKSDTVDIIPHSWHKIIIKK